MSANVAVGSPALGSAFIDSINACAVASGPKAAKRLPPDCS